MIKSHLLPATFFLLLNLFTLTSYAWQLKPFEASYTASISGIVIEGQATYELKKLSTNKWQLQTIANMALIERKETTIFTINHQIIQPELYEFHQIGIKPTDSTIQFDWKKQLAKATIKNKNFSFALKDNILDPLSSQVALLQDIATGKRTLSYLVIDENKTKLFKFKIVGQETINTPQGKINTIKVERIREKDDKRKTFIWFAKDWNYIVVQLYQLEKNGNAYTISLANGTLNGKTIKGK